MASQAVPFVHSRLHTHTAIARNGENMCVVCVIHHSQSVKVNDKPDGSDTILWLLRMFICTEHLRRILAQHP